MEPKRALLDSWPGEFARTVEMMTGAEVRVTNGFVSANATLWWESRLSGNPPLRILAGASRESWHGIGSAILEAAGVESSDDAEVRGTWIELLGQTASSVAGALTTPTARFENAGGSEVAAPAGERHSFAVSIGPRSFELQLVLPDDKPAPQTSMVPVAASAITSRTMDALLDVHLPVAISFGHARLPLKDVLKLTTGTVVELNRQPEDPVDIIVNDCVIARGEVVVVDGNYAVRIQSIVGRQDRLGISTAAFPKGRGGK